MAHHMRFRTEEIPTRSGASVMFNGHFVIGELGTNARAYRVDLLNENAEWQTIGIVVGSTKYGKPGWEAWAPAGKVMIACGFRTRAKAAECLQRLAEAMNAITALVTS